MKILSWFRCPASAAGFLLTLTYTRALTLAPLALHIYSPSFRTSKRTCQQYRQHSPNHIHCLTLNRKSKTMTRSASVPADARVRKRGRTAARNQPLNSTRAPVPLAAFPSQTFHVPDSQGQPRYRHGIRELIEAKQRGSDDGRFARMEDVYTGRGFPDGMLAIDRQWYENHVEELEAIDGEYTRCGRQKVSLSIPVSRV